MVLCISNPSRRADAENTPPAKAGGGKKVRGGIQGASRRRRARSSGGPHHPRYAIEHAKQKSVARYQPPPINVAVPRSSPEADEPDDSMTTLALPRYLGRPYFVPVAKDKLTSLAPELVDTEVGYVREALRSLGPHMLQVLAGVEARPTSNVLPKEFPVVVNDLSCDMPTHMLAVYARDIAPWDKRRATLYPIHNIILATHCANLPVLPNSDVLEPTTPGSTISLPVVPLCIPAPELFPQLTTFLYTKRIDHLLASLLPRPVPHALYRDDPTTESSIKLLQQFADDLAATHDIPALLRSVMSVNGLWRNVCALGIDDESVWCALDVAWEVLRTALAISTGRQL